MDNTQEQPLFTPEQVAQETPQTPAATEEAPAVSLFTVEAVETEEKQEETKAEEAEKEILPQKITEKITEYVGLAGYQNADDGVKKALKFAEATATNPQEFFQKISEFYQMQPISLESINLDNTETVKSLIKSDLKARYSTLSEEELEAEAEDKLLEYEESQSKVKRSEYLRGIVERENERRKSALGDIDSNIFGTIDTKTETEVEIIQPELTQEMFDGFIGERIAIEPIKVEAEGMKLLTIDGGAKLIESKANEYYESLVKQNLVVDGGKIVLPDTFDKERAKAEATRVAHGLFLVDNFQALINAAVQTAIKQKENGLLKQAGIGTTIVQKNTDVPITSNPNLPTMEQWNGRK